MISARWSKQVHISVTAPLIVEHIMPQAWIKCRPLPDGSTGMTKAELWSLILLIHEP